MSEARTVLVTGANAGLGLATVVEVARRGFHVVGSVRSEEKAELVATTARANNVDVDTVLLDIDDASRCAEVIDTVRPWGIVNNAAFLDMRRVEDVDDDEARRYFETLVISPMRLCRLALPHMRAGGGGRIVQVSSISGRTSFPLLGWYQAAKQALEGVSDALRMEAAGDGITVSIIEPGAFDTGMTDDLGPMQWIRNFMSSTDNVATVVADALTARVPRARYVVGLDAKVNALTYPITPTVVRDRIMRMLYKT